jgi:uncharacterized protein DUF4328
MPELVCATCGHRWQSSAAEELCPHCLAIKATEWGVTATSVPEPSPPEAISEGEPPFVLPVDDEPPRPRVRTPKGWVAHTITIALVGLSAGVDMLYAGVEAQKLKAVLARDGQLYAEAQRLTNILALIEMLLLVGTAAATMRWVYVAYRNLRRLRAADVSELPAASFVYWFFPPGLFYVAPRRLQEIWRASDPTVPMDSDAWKSSPGNWLVWLWWGLFIARNIRINISINPFPANDPTMLNILLASAWITIGSCLAGLAAAFVFIVLLLQIERRQWRRYDHLQDW